MIMAIRKIIAIILCFASCSFVFLQDNKATEEVTVIEVIETAKPTEMVEYEVVEEVEPTEHETIEILKPTEVVEPTEAEQHIVTATPAHETPDVWVEHAGSVVPIEIQPVVEPSIELPEVWTPPQM